MEKKLSLPLSISVGVSYFHHGDEWNDKKKESDDALYYVKNNINDKNSIAFFDYKKGDIKLYNKENN